MKKYQKVENGFSSLRRSARLTRTSPESNGDVGLFAEKKEDEAKSVVSSGNRQKELCDDLNEDESCLEALGRLTKVNYYESNRNTRIQENQARLALLGVKKALFDLRSTISSPKPVRKLQKVDYGLSLRRSARLNSMSPHNETLEVHRKNEEKFLKSVKPELSPEVVARRCLSKTRGTVYNPVYGICCHYCRQKTLCSESECKHCGDLDLDQPCIGKTECSVCHSSNGILCRACLKVRYGEEMEEVRKNEGWMCPHCVEDKGTIPYWICNSSICLKKRKLAPTGIAIYKARELGYKSVAHLLMDQLQHANNLMHLKQM